jgi:hypothetical protein
MTFTNSFGLPTYPFHLFPMVKITDDTSICGDSGGGWSWGETAWGVHAGRAVPEGTNACETPGSGLPGYFSDLQSIEIYFDVTVKRLPL